MMSNRGMEWDRGVLWFFAIIVFIGMVAVVLYPVFARVHPPSPRRDCLCNMKRLSTAMNMYGSDWDDRFPTLTVVQACAPKGKGWEDRLMVYARNKRVNRCPSAPDRLTYSFNRQLAGLKDAKVANSAETVAIFESVNAMPESNNLNGGVVCHPNKDRMPLPGQYIVWPKDADKLQRNWPDWARCNHGDVTMVVYADGHAKGVPSTCEPVLSPK